MPVYCIIGGFILFDILTGFAKALAKEGINSTKIRNGLYHKLSEIIAVLFSYFLEYSADYINLGVDLPVVGVVAVYICVMEFVSILENICEMNPQMYNLFKPYLEKLKQEEKANG